MFSGIFSVLHGQYLLLTSAAISPFLIPLFGLSSHPIFSAYFFACSSFLLNFCGSTFSFRVIHFRVSYAFCPFIDPVTLCTISPFLNPSRSGIEAFPLNHLVASGCLSMSICAMFTWLSALAVLSSGPW